MTSNQEVETKPSSASWWTLFVVCTATFMLLLDVSIVNVALDSIERDLGATFTDLQWVIDAYVLTLAAFILTFGSASDLLGRRRVFLAGIVLFTIASLLCGLATTPGWLNAARALQGVGAAAMFATTLALISQEFQGKARGTAFGAWGATTGAAVAIGPLIGGLLIDGLGWEWIFFVNVPVGLFAVAITLARVPARRELRTPSARIDVPGLITFSTGLFLLVFGLVRGNLDGWTSPLILACLLGSVALLVAFVVIEARSAAPMLALNLFGQRTFVGASIAALTLSGSIFALFLYVALYLQQVLGYDPLQTGLQLLPTSIISFAVAAIAGRLSAIVSARLLMSVGLATIGIGLILMAVMIEPDSTVGALQVGLCLTGVGVGLVNPSLASTAVGVAKAAQAGMAGGINSTFRQIGIATGIAGLGAVFQQRMQSSATETLSAGALEPGDIDAIANSSMTGRLDESLSELTVQAQEVAREAIRSGFVDGFTTISGVAAAIALFGAISVVVSVRTEDLTDSGAVAKEGA